MTTVNHSERQYSLDDLLRVMARLRDPNGGCPWDLKQTFETIVPSTLEECYELADAIEQQDMPHIAEELGDVLFQVIFYSQLGSEEGAFDFSSVVHTLVEKLLRRHPHVFAEGQIEGRVDEVVDTTAVKANWEAIKQQERDAKAKTGALADVPLALPALPRAQKLQKRAANVGFDWSEFDAVLENLESEIAELREALTLGDADHVEDEFGDVLFSVVNVGRHLKLDAERSLRRANTKFERRFQRVEAMAEANNQVLKALTEAQLQSYWQHAKAAD